MRGAHDERLTAVIGKDWQPDTIEQAFQEAVDSKKQEMQDSGRERDGVSQNLIKWSSNSERPVKN